MAEGQEQMDDIIDEEDQKMLREIKRIEMEIKCYDYKTNVQLTKENMELDLELQEKQQRIHWLQNHMASVDEMISHITELSIANRQIELNLNKFIPESMKAVTELYDIKMQKLADQEAADKATYERIKAKNEQRPDVQRLMAIKAEQKKIEEKIQQIQDAKRAELSKLDHKMIADTDNKFVLEMVLLYDKFRKTAEKSKNLDIQTIAICEEEKTLADNIEKAKKEIQERKVEKEKQDRQMAFELISVNFDFDDITSNVNCIELTNDRPEFKVPKVNKKPSIVSKYASGYDTLLEDLKTLNESKLPSQDAQVKRYAEHYLSGKEFIEKTDVKRQKIDEIVGGTEKKNHEKEKTLASSTNPPNLRENLVTLSQNSVERHRVIIQPEIEITVISPELHNTINENQCLNETPKPVDKQSHISDAKQISVIESIVIKEADAAPSTSKLTPANKTTEKQGESPLHLSLFANESNKSDNDNVDELDIWGNFNAEDTSSANDFNFFSSNNSGGDNNNGKSAFSFF